MSSVTLSEEFVNNSIRVRDFIYNFINSGRMSLYPENLFTFHFVEIVFSVSESMKYVLMDINDQIKLAT